MNLRSKEVKQKLFYSAQSNLCRITLKKDTVIKGFYQKYAKSQYEMIFMASLSRPGSIFS
jgi:hypothetical protein